MVVHFTYEKAPAFQLVLIVLALPIFPASYPASIVGADELNFCVRDGNRWTLIAINTNLCRWLVTTFMSKRCRSNRLEIIPASPALVNTFSHFQVNSELVTRTGFEPMLKA